MSDILNGKVYSYDSVRKFGRIITSQNQRFFFHRDAILVGPPEPRLDQVVLFRADERPALPGKLPVAREVELLEDVEKPGAVVTGLGVQS